MTIKGIVCLVGSVRQRDDWLKATQELTRKGFVVLEAGDYTTESEKPKEVWDLITEVHHRKIEMADFVAIIRKPHGGIGKHTYEDVLFAEQHQKPITYVEEL